MDCFQASVSRDMRLFISLRDGFEGSEVIVTVVEELSGILCKSVEDKVVF